MDRTSGFYEFPLSSTWRDDGIRPARPHLTGAQERVGTLTDVKLAWQKLGQAGLLPRINPDLPIRLFRRIGPQPQGQDSRELTRFIENMDGGPPARQRYFVTDRNEPFSVEDAVLIAADAAGIEHAETAGYTARHCLQPWGMAPPNRIAWRVMSSKEPTFRTPGSSLLDDLRVFLAEAFDQAGHKITPYPLASPEPPNHQLWQLAVEHDYRVPYEVEDPYGAFGAGGPPLVPSAAAGKRFRELPNPFEPIHRLAQNGYRLDAFTDEEIVLLVPPR
jgi:hypothetical protein